MNGKKLAAVAPLMFALILFCAAPGRQQAQDDKDNKNPYATMAPQEQYMMDRDAEIELARSAAPVAISREATVIVLTREGYKVAVQGKNGFVCDVERAWMSPFDNPEFWNPKTRSAICYNREAAGSPLQVTFLRSKLVLQGLSKEQIREGVKAAFDKKEIPPVEPGAMCFMMAKGTYLSDNALTADGAHNMAHLMFFTPRISPADWGANVDKSPVVMDPARKGDPQPIDVYMVLTGRWSDGTPAPLQ